MGRAALALGQEGIEPIFGDTLAGGRMTGVVARASGWVAVRDVAVVAVHDRYPSQRRAARYASILEGRGALPMGNAPAITLLCRDKLTCQRVLERGGLRLPEVEGDPARFRDSLAAWGAGFLKPRFGALGVGVRRVVPGDPLPERLPGVVLGVLEPAILQRAVPPPAGWAGRVVRVLCQARPSGGGIAWVRCPVVVRQSRQDPVVNAARGADVQPAEDALSAQTRADIDARCQQVCQILSREGLAVELGIDLVLGARGEVRVIEVNSRPRGRLEVLAERDPARFGSAHVAACARPIRMLAALAGR